MVWVLLIKALIWFQHQAFCNHFLLAIPYYSWNEPFALPSVCVCQCICVCVCVIWVWMRFVWVSVCFICLVSFVCDLLLFPASTCMHVCRFLLARSCVPVSVPLDICTAHKSKSSCLYRYHCGVVHGDDLTNHVSPWQTGDTIESLFVLGRSMSSWKSSSIHQFSVVSKQASGWLE